LLAHAEVLVVGNAGKEAMHVLSATGRDVRIIDLTRNFDDRADRGADQISTDYQLAASPQPV